MTSSTALKATKIRKGTLHNDLSAQIALAAFYAVEMQQSLEWGTEKRQRLLKA